MSDSFEERAEARAPGHRSVGRGLLMAGVVAAGALGVAAGMWARPADSERHAAMRAQKAAAPAARAKSALQIVVDEKPAPLGQPLEVMPAASAPLPGEATAPPAEFHLEEVAPAPTLPAPEMAPRPAPNGLLRVQAISQPAPPPEPAPAAAPVVRAVAKPAPKPAPAKAAPAKAARGRLADEPAPKVSKAAVARPAQKPAQKSAAKLVKVAAPAAKAKPARDSAAARENAALRARLQKAEAQLAKAERATRPKLAAAVKALKTSTRTAKPSAKAAPKPTKARVVARPARRAPEPVARPVSEPRLQKAVARRPAAQPKPTPVKVAKAAPRAQGRCASGDAAQAMVCRDPSLGAADRELGRAYRQAEAAGVPSWRLAQQQQRWAAARANAAREAPWAVRDVYQAQIAQLRDMSQRAGSEN